MCRYAAAGLWQASQCRLGCSSAALCGKKVGREGRHQADILLSCLNTLQHLQASLVGKGTRKDKLAVLGLRLLAVK